MTTTETPIMQLHDITGEQFVKAVTDIIITTLESDKCDDVIDDAIREYVSSESIMNEDEVEEKIESAIDNIDWQDKINDAIGWIDDRLKEKIEEAIDENDWSEKINEAIDENDAFDLEEKVRMALDTPITELRKDIHDLKVECNSLREHNRRTLDVVSTLIELVRAINNK